MSNPLIAAEKHEFLTGAGLADVAWNFSKSVAEGDAVSSGFGAAAVGLEALSAAANPLKAAVVAGVGWILEYFEWPREALNKVTGNPDAIKALVTTWANIARELSETSASTGGAKSVVDGWTGRAAEAHRILGDAVKTITEAVAKAAKRLAGDIEMAGIAVATIRSFVVDWIAEAIAKAIAIGLAALAASVPTAGGSFIAAALEIIRVVAKLIGDISKLFQELSVVAAKIGKSFKSLGDISSKTGDEVAAVADRLGKAGRSLDDNAPALARGAVDGLNKGVDRVNDLNPLRGRLWTRDRALDLFDPPEGPLGPRTWQEKGARAADTPAGDWTAAWTASHADVHGANEAEKRKTGD